VNITQKLEHHKNLRFHSKVRLNVGVPVSAPGEERARLGEDEAVGAATRQLLHGNPV